MDENSPSFISCLLCKATIHFEGLPASRYESHLFREHNVMHGKERIVEWTLQEQFPALAQPIQCDTCKNATNEESPEIQPPAVMTNTIKLEPGTTGADANRILQQVGDFSEWVKGKCLFKCSLCLHQKVFRDMVEFKLHVQSSHFTSYKNYLATFSDPCILEKRTTCLICQKEVIHDLSALSEHFLDKHQLGVKSYFEKYVAGVSNDEPPVDSLDTQEPEEGTEVGEDQSNDGGAAEPMDDDNQDNDDDDDDIEIIDFVKSTVPEKTLSVKREVKTERRENVDAESSTDSFDASDVKMELVEPYEAELFSELGGGSEESSDQDNGQNSLLTSESENASGVKVPWYCGMLFSCKFCPRQFFEPSDLKRHLVMAHETSFEDASAEHGDMAVVTNVHECFICGRGMPHCQTSIKNHLGKVHDMTITLYYDQNKEDIDNEAVELPITDPKLRVRTVTSGRSCQSSTPVSSATQKSANEWLNKCLYACKVCNKYEASTYTAFIGHIHVSHKETAKSYSQKFGPKFHSKLVSHTCQICGLILDWDRSPIAAHLHRLHASVSVPDYVQTYQESYTDNPELAENENEKWMNGCIFQCKECQKPENFNTRNKLALHLHREHQMTIKVYSDKHGSLFSRFATIVCKVCDKSMRWDSDTLIAHMDKVHSMTPDTYAKEYMKEELDNILKAMSKRKARSNKAASNPEASTSSSEPPLIESDWLNQCQLSCNLCDYETKFYNGFLTHISNEHKLNSKDFKAQNNGELYSKLVHHVCQICGNVMIWNRHSILHHLKDKHNSVNVGDYEATYRSCYQENVVFEENPAHQWMDRCTLECKECPQPKFFRSRNKLVLHLYKEHEMAIKDYLSKHGTVYTTFEFYSCKICDKSVRWESDNIIAHLDKFHQMTPEQYLADVLNNDIDAHLADFNRRLKPASQNEDDTQQVGSGQSRIDWLNRCKFKCNLCDLETLNNNHFLNHLHRQHAISGKDYADKNGGKLFSTLVNHTCQLCGFILPWERGGIGKHLNHKHNSISLQDYMDRFIDTYTDFPELPDNKEDEWMNQCQFECRECSPPSYYSTRNKLILHLSKDHQMSIKEYIGKDKNIISVMVNHICKICDKSMRWDGDTITAHLDKFHSTSPQTYFEQHLKDLNLELLKTPVRVGKPVDESYLKPCPTLKWSDKCHFVCQVCYTVVRSKNILKWHVFTEHKMYENYYNEHFATEVLIKVTHGCLICNEEFLFDSQTLKRHLINNHAKMSETEYKSEYFSKFSLHEVKQELEHSWLYKSLFSCKICMKIVRGKDTFKKHLASEHSKHYNSYVEVHGSGVFKEKFHTCLVEDQKKRPCSKQIPWDGRSMTYHLSKHSLTPEAYHSMFMTNDPDGIIKKIVKTETAQWASKCTFLCKTCCKIFDVKAKLYDHIKESHGQSVPDDSSIKDCIVDFRLHSCQICSENILWDEDTLENHFASEHKIWLSEYATKHLKTYQESESCRKEIQDFDAWTTRCLYRCLICPSKPEMNRRMTLLNHICKKHRAQSAGYFTKYEEETFVKKSEHVCQECGQTILWDPRYLQRHIEKTHRMKTSVYRAKYMSRYTEDVEEIEARRKEQNKQSKSSKRPRSVAGICKTEPLSTQTTATNNLSDDEDQGMTEEVQTWARGCLYSCAICDIDIAGIKPFESHLTNLHQTSFFNYKRKYGANQACAISGFHFCKLCCNNVRHDELDLMNHFSKDHKMSVVEYFEKFRGKLRMPKLERPKITRTSLNNSSTVNESNNNSSSSKRRSLEDLKPPVDKKQKLN